MIFLSHALPEDNEFTRWQALRLAREGYPVWCDLTKLLGGEDYESATRQHRSRRSQCRMWHNDTWLARMLVAMVFLAEEGSESLIRVPLGEDAAFEVDARPLRFENPVSIDAVLSDATPDDDELDAEPIEEEEEECPI